MVVITTETGKKREIEEALTGYFHTHLKMSTRMGRRRGGRERKGKTSEMTSGILVLCE